jgi:hypothetical protein
MVARTDTRETRLFLRGHGEWPIAISRFMLALATPLVLWIEDPVVPAAHLQITYAVAVGYICYSLCLLVLVRRPGVPGAGLGIVAHSLDLAVFALFIFFSTGATSLFFVYFVFAITAAAMRREGRGALWTTLVATLIVFAGVYLDPEYGRRPILAANSVVVRAAYLAMVGLILWYANGHEARQRRRFSRLAAWPVASDASTGVGELLRHSAGVLKTPRVLLCWEDPEEPWLYTGLWDGKVFERSQEAPGAFGTLVSNALLGTSFFCRDASVENPLAVCVTTDKTVWKSRGRVIHRALQKHFDITSVLALSLQTGNLQGYVFGLDRAGMTPDDLALGRIAADEIGIRLNSSIS